MQRMFISSSRRAATFLQSATTSNISRTSSSSTRYLSSAAIANDDEINDGRFSIQGTFREGQASYLDMSATTPLDPRVLDKMMPYMVRSIGLYFVYVSISYNILKSKFCSHHVFFSLLKYHHTLITNTIRQ